MFPSDALPTSQSTTPGASSISATSIVTPASSHGSEIVSFSTSFSPMHTEEQGTGPVAVRSMPPSGIS